MAPRANWKGFLKLSLVTCPVALFPATSETEKVSFNQINKQTGHRIKYTKVDAETGDEVPSEDIIKTKSTPTPMSPSTRMSLRTLRWKAPGRSTSTNSSRDRKSMSSISCGPIRSSPMARSDTTPMPSSAKRSGPWTR
jgi:hypothetical protein